MQYLFMINGSEFCCVFLLIYVIYHVTFDYVVEKATLLQIVFNILMLYNNVSILYVLSEKCQLKCQI